MILPDYIKEDLWLSHTIERPCFNLHAKQFLETQQEIQSINLPEKCFIQTKIHSHKLELSIALQNQGFLVIDTNVSYELNLNKYSPKPTTSDTYNFRPAKPDDQKQVMQCALNSFIYTRYHLDPKFDNRKADLIKSEWAGNYFNGKRGQLMMLATDKVNNIVGFCQILEPNLNTRIVDLIAVREKHRRHGLARGMISHSITNQEKIIVGTQVSNIPSIRCYENIGFRHAQSQYVLHYHGQ